MERVTTILDLPKDLFTSVLNATIVFGGSASPASCATAEAVRDFVHLTLTCKHLWHLGTVQSSRTIWWPLATLALRVYDTADFPKHNYNDEEPSFWYKLVISQLYGCIGPLPGHLLGLSRQRFGYIADRDQTRRIMEPNEAFDSILKDIDDREYDMQRIRWMPCPAAGAAKNLYVRHFVEDHHDVEAHFQFLPWLAARLRFGPQPWLLPPPPEHDCPYIGHTEGFLCSNEAENEWRAIDWTVRVIRSSNTTIWPAVVKEDMFSSVFSKFGNGDGNYGLTHDSQDEYHEDTIRRARNFIDNLEEYDLDSCQIYALGSIHNNFRADLVGGSSYCEELFSIWLSNYAILEESGEVEDWYNEDLMPCVKLFPPM